EREDVVVAAGVDEFEFAGLMVLALGVLAGEKKAFNFRGGVERVLLFLEQVVCVVLEHAAKIARVLRAILVDDIAEDEHLAVAEDVGGHPVEGAPVDAEAEIALFLGGEAADRRAIESEILISAEEELLVVIEKVKAALEIGEEHRNRLDALFICQILDPLLADLVGRDVVGAIAL